MRPQAGPSVPDRAAAEAVLARLVAAAHKVVHALDHLACALGLPRNVLHGHAHILQLLGMGSGQPNRVKSVEIAMEKAGDEVKGAALASDAFFPFAWGDAVEQACQAGVGAIIHPGGSMRDQDAIDCCNKYGVVLVFTGVRHFRH